MKYYSRIPFLLLLIGLLASVWTAGRRMVIERHSRTVELTVDMEQLRSLALDLGVPLGDALVRLKAAGVTSVALNEQTLVELETDGLARVRQAVRDLPSGVTEVRIHQAGLYRQVEEALQFKIRSASSDPDGRALQRQVRIQGPGGETRWIPAGWSAVRSLPIGIAAEDAALVRSHGLGIVARVQNFAAVDGTAIRAMAARLKAVGAHAVVFAGEEVLGNRARIKETAAALEAHGLSYGSVEFGKQRGDEALSRALRGRIIRVHSIQTAEMQKLAEAEVINRFVKATEERNIRLLYLRFLPHVTERPFEDNLRYIASLTRELQRRDLELGTARPFPPVHSEISVPAAAQGGPSPAPGSSASRWLGRLFPALSALTVAGGVMLLLAGLIWMPKGRQGSLALLAGGMCALLVLGGGDTGRKLLALAGAVIFPTLAFVWFAPGQNGGQRGAGQEWPAENGRRRSAPRSLPQAPGIPLLQFLALCGVTLLGALTVVGLLSERTYMVKVSSFVGIKAAHFLPLAAIGLLYATGSLGAPRPWPEFRARATENLRRLLGERMLLWHLAGGVVALAAIAVLLARTGNDPGVGISGVEMKLRDLLDRYLVRPRTKEFLVGHPALLAAVVLATARVGKGLIGPLAVVGAIGQVSLVNSFCHLHTPLLLTAIRSFNGLWLGVLLGLVLVWAIRRALPKAEAPAGAVEPPLARTGTAR